MTRLRLQNAGDDWGQYSLRFGASLVVREDASMADDKAPAVPKVEALAFFTTNDSRPSLGIGVKAPAAAKLTSSERYQKRAESLATAGRIHGVDSVQAATAVLKALPSDVKLEKVFFVGHGFDNGFFFHGRPDPKDPDNFIADNGNVETLQDPAKLTDATAKQQHEEFINELVKHLHKSGQVEIGFLSCFTGTGSTVRAVGKTLAKAGFQDFKVGGYKNDYQTRYIFDSKTGAILKWTDEILDKNNPTKLLVKEDKNRIPAYETDCGKSNDPLSLLLPC